jgi:hypothetical protein
MPSPALAAYAAAVDGMRLSADDKVALKAHGERLYIAATREAPAHQLVHLNAEANERGDTAELRARMDLFRAVLTRTINASDNLALTIAGALDG